MTDLTSAAAEYRAALVRFVDARVRDHAAAEDIVQMTRNAIADHHRAARPTEELPEDLIAPEPEADALAEMAQCLMPFIAQLPEAYRVAFELSEVQGVTRLETARRLGISLSGAKSRVQRARTKLQEMLLACCRMEQNPCACGPPASSPAVAQAGRRRSA